MLVTFAMHLISSTCTCMIRSRKSLAEWSWGHSMGFRTSDPRRMWWVKVATEMSSLVSMLSDIPKSHEIFIFLLYIFMQDRIGTVLQTRAIVIIQPAMQTTCTQSPGHFICTDCNCRKLQFGNVQGEMIKGLDTTFVSPSLHLGASTYFAKHSCCKCCESREVLRTWLIKKRQAIPNILAVELSCHLQKMERCIRITITADCR